ncbi:MAG: MBL fold metallo-hydrolase [Chloroflexi bacterium]|nr:MBL fold metallo-hydrolase [Chloroflexota bacterium]
MKPNLSFLGAAGTVTGSRHLLQINGKHYLVDCGLFQGGRRLRQKNWEPFPFPPEQIDAILITHAHIDHSGYLPRLVREGFRGPVYASEATCSLLEILLPDSAHLQEQDALYANKKGFSRHKPALPLYTRRDVEQTLPLLRPVSFRKPLELDQLVVTWWPAGHILGSSWLQAEIPTFEGGCTVVFSGDLGRYGQEVMADPHPGWQADYLIVESTYGGRLHEETPIGDVLEKLIRSVTAQRGVLLIPAFAIGRTQQVLYHIRRLQDQGRISDLPVFIDSPMAVEASHLYCRFGDDHNLDVNLLMDERQCPLRCNATHFVTSVEESKQINQMSGPAIVLSASGMCTGGRILHHLKWRLPDKRNIVLFVGYQAEGSRGRLLLEGAETIKIHGEHIPVRAQIARADALSGHADENELLRWLTTFQRPPTRTFIVHGEMTSSQALQRTIHQRLQWKTTIPIMGDQWTLNGTASKNGYTSINA